MATIRKRGNTYQICVSTGYDTKGNHKEQAMTWKPEPNMTERQIQKELNRQSVMFEEQCLKGYQSKAIKFEEFAEQWFEEYAKPNLRNTTYERMLQLRGRVYAAIGHLRMDKITPRQIQAFVNTLSKDGANERTGKPLAPKTIRHNLSLISDVFSYAVNVGVAADNPCSKVTLPKDTPKEKKIYTREEVERFLTLLNSEPLKYRVFFNLLIYSGFRRGERDHQCPSHFQLYRKEGNLHRYHKDEKVSALLEVPERDHGYAQGIQGRTGRGSIEVGR